MKFSDIKGNDDIVRTLSGMIDGGRIPNAMMFYENDGCGAFPLVISFLQYLFCNKKSSGDSCGICPECNKVVKFIHPDIHFVFPVTGGSKISSSEKPTSDSYMKYWRELVSKNPFFLENDLNSALGIEGKSSTIAVAEAKSVLDKLSLFPVEGGYQAIVLYLPEKMNVDAANRLLKIVEEPPEKVLFLFITHSPEKVLQTISSRCQGIRVCPLGKEQVADVLVSYFGKTPEDAANAAAIAGGSIGNALHYLADRSDYKTDLGLFSDLLKSMMDGDLLSALSLGEIIASMDSREKQKAFCKFAGDCFRKIFLLQNDLSVIAGISGEEFPFFSHAAKMCKRTFCRNAIVVLDRTYFLLNRNVNQKILFCDMVNRMFVKI
jgi:DNA polymerase-3 subunit delta'